MGEERQAANQLYLRLPVRIVDQHQILSLHPKITQVRLPRQKSRRWCIIECASDTELVEVQACLKRVKVAGKRLKRSPRGPVRVRMRQFIGNPYDVELESDEDLVELQELDENAAGTTMILNYLDLPGEQPESAHSDSVTSDPDFDPSDSEMDLISYYTWTDALAFSSDEGDSEEWDTDDEVTLPVGEAFPEPPA